MPILQRSHTQLQKEAKLRGAAWVERRFTKIKHATKNTMIK